MVESAYTMDLKSLGHCDLASSNLARSTINQYIRCSKIPILMSNLKLIPKSYGNGGSVSSL